VSLKPSLYVPPFCVKFKDGMKLNLLPILAEETTPAVNPVFPPYLIEACPNVSLT
jgi:hypothetical protein